MIDLIPAFIYAKDAQSRFTACNKLVAAPHGRHARRGHRQDRFRFLSARDGGEVLQRRAGAAPVRQAAHRLRGESRIDNDHWHRPRASLTSKIPLHDAHGNLTGVVGTGFDITERKAAEERMASSDRLESIGRLAAGVAHEINTPIQYLNDSVSFIREGVGELLALHRQAARGHAAEAEKPEATTTSNTCAKSCRRR